MSPAPRVPSWSIRFEVIVVAALSSVVFSSLLPPFFVLGSRALRIRPIARASTSGARKRALLRGDVTDAAAGCATGAGLASARVVKKRVMNIANMLDKQNWNRCEIFIAVDSLRDKFESFVDTR